jgi:hypothetical protein
MKCSSISISLVLALSSGPFGACTASNDGVPLVAGTSRSTSAVTLRGTIDQTLVNPQGDIDGILLQDGTLVRVAPGSVLANQLSPNEKVEVSGMAGGNSESPTMERATISHEGVVLTADSSPPRPRSRAVAEAALTPITDSAIIRRLLRNPEGVADGLLLNDGASVRFPPTSGLDALGLKPGDRVSVAGRGTDSPAGRGIRAEQITGANGKPVRVDVPPIIPTPIARDGAVERLLINPRGDVDIMLLTDGAVIRIPPTPSTVASSIQRGTAVHIEGESEGSVIHASTVRGPGGAVLASEPAAPPPAPPVPDEGLMRIDAAGAVMSILRAPRGEIDEILLSDGTIVKLPRRLANSIPASSLAVGTQVRVEGPGGRYPLGTALRADTLRLASGQTFEEPSLSGPPPGRPGPAPISPPVPPG